MKRPFRERDPRKLAVVGVTALVLAVAAAIGVPQLVFYTRTAAYTAELANAAGLRADDQVFVAGVPAGRVRAITLAGDRVRVDFRLDRDQPLGEATSAGVKIQTVLGKRYLDVRPDGAGALPSGGTIPLARTSVPFSLDDLGRAAADTTQKLDLGSLRKMITTLRDNAPDAKLAGDALDGVTSATAVFTKYSKGIQDLLAGARSVTSTLVGQQDSLVKLLGDTDLITRALVARKDTLNQLVSDVGRLADRIRSFLDTNRPLVEPLMHRLGETVRTLTDNAADLGRTIDMLAPTGRYLANATGNGPWIDVVGPAAIVPDPILCVTGLVRGCK